MDLFGTKALTRTVTELSVQITEQKQAITEQREVFEIKLNEAEAMTEKAATTALSMAMRNFNMQIFPHFNSALQERAYQNSDDLHSVVSRIANAAASIPFYPELPKGQEPQPSDKIFKFLDTLTLEQRTALYSYYLIQGEMFAYKEKLEFGVNRGLQKLHILNPANVTVFISNTFPIEVLGYRYWDSLNGFQVDIGIEDMMFVKMFNPDTDIIKAVRGLSPVTVLKKRLERSDANLNISIAQMQNGGVPGIVYDETPGLGTAQTGTTETSVLGKRRDSFGRFLQNESNKGAPYFAAGKMGYIAIGSTLADMNLAELSAIDLDKICNVYHVSSTEFNNKQASTESNVATHSKSFYVNGVLPIVCALKDGLNRQVLTDVDTKAHLEEDFSDIEVLQPDQLKKMQAYAAAPVMIPNQVLEALGQKTKEGDPLMDKVYLKTGYAPIEEADMIVPAVDNTAGDYNDAVDGVVKMLKTA